MKRSFVVTVTCPDRPGIVEEITEVMARFSANWEESRKALMTHAKSRAGPSPWKKTSSSGQAQTAF